MCGISVTSLLILIVHEVNMFLTFTPSTVLTYPEIYNQLIKCLSNYVFSKYHNSLLKIVLKYQVFLKVSIFVIHVRNILLYLGK